jgi:ADP-ribosyl-[dinitrogen reductase] hydrolase
MGLFSHLALSCGGALLLSAHPGAEGDASAAISAYRAAGATLLVSLPPSAELATLGLGEIDLACAAAEIAWAHCPIPDFEAPGPLFHAAWRALRPRLFERLDAGESVVLHCRAGLGRTGTVAALILIERGLSPRDAMGQVRRARPGAIETAVQVEFLETGAIP